MIKWNDPEPMKSGGEMQTSECGRFRIYLSVLGGWSVGYRSTEFAPWKPIDPHHGGHCRWHQSRKSALQVVESFAVSYNGAESIPVKKEPVLVPSISKSVQKHHRLERSTLMSENETNVAVADAPVAAKTAKKRVAKKAAPKEAKVSPKKKAAAAKATKGAKSSKKAAKAPAKPSKNGAGNLVTVLSAINQLGGKNVPRERIVAKCEKSGLVESAVLNQLYNARQADPPLIVKGKHEDGSIILSLTATGRKVAEKS